MLGYTEECERRCRMVAHIIGSTSAAQNALNKLDALRAQGIPAAVVDSNGKWVVIQSSTHQPHDDA